MCRDNKLIFREAMLAFNLLLMSPLYDVKSASHLFNGDWSQALHQPFCLGRRDVILA
jgi:hypothetical protein